MNTGLMLGTWLAGATGGGTGGWTIGGFLQQAANALNGWGSIVVVILGIIAILVAAYQIVTGLISHGKKQTSWPIVIALLIVGGIFVAIGVGKGIQDSSVGQIANGVGIEVNSMGNGGSATGAVTAH